MSNHDIARETVFAGRTANVPVKPASSSKINWLNLVGFGAAIASWYGLDVDAETQAAIAVGIGAVTQIGSFVLRTWFTKSVTPASLK